MVETRWGVWQLPEKSIWLSLSQWATETESTPKSDQEWARTTFRGTGNRGGSSRRTLIGGSKKRKVARAGIGENWLKRPTLDLQLKSVGGRSQQNQITHTSGGSNWKFAFLRRDWIFRGPIVSLKHFGTVYKWGHRESILCKDTGPLFVKTKGWLGV